MKVKKILFWTLLLTLVATPLLAMEVGKPVVRRRRSDADVGDDSSNPTEENRRQEEILEAARTDVDYSRGDRLPSEKRKGLPSSQGSGVQDGNRTINTYMSSTIEDRLPAYSSISSYPPNSDKTETGGSSRIVQLPQGEDSLRRGIEDGEYDFNSFSKSSTELTGHHISVVSASPVYSFDPERLSSIIGKNKKIAALDEQMSSLEQEHAAQKASIIDQAKQEIKQVENKAEMTPERVIAAGLPSVLNVRPDQKKNALQKINTAAARTISVLFFDHVKRSSRIQELRYTRLLEKRLMRNATPIKEGTQTDPSSPEARILKALELKQRAFDFLGESPELASKEDLGLAAHIISNADAIATIAFSEGTEKEIEEATLQLEELPHSLSAIADGDLPEQNKFSSRQLTKELQGLCEQNRAEFQFAQTESDQRAGAVAAKNAGTLFQRAQKLRGDAENGRKQIPFATLANQENLNKQVEKFTELASVLETTALAYDQIADHCSVELRTIPEVKENLAKAQDVLTASSAAVTSGDSKSALKSEMLTDLRSLLDSTNLQSPERGATFGLDILSQLKNITDRDEDVVTASNDKIVLAALASPFSADANHHPYIHGTHLIRLAIFREFGSHGLQRFDDQFAPNIAAETPIRLGEIKEFIAQEGTEHDNPSSYFIAEHHSIEELLKIPEGSPEAQKIIKADGSSVISFNPFLTTSTARQTLADEAGSVQRGIKVAKMTLKNFLEKEPMLDPVQIVTILRNFDATFNAADPKKQLTVEKLKTFTESELKRALAGMTLAEWLSASPRNSGLNSLSWRVVTAGTASVLMSSPHLSALVKFVILVSEQAASDQTVLWRARSGAPASGGH